MSQTAGANNIKKFDEWIIKIKADGWKEFKNLDYCVYRGTLSKSKVHQAARIGLKALKDGNPRLIAIFEEFELEANKHFPEIFQRKISSKQLYHDRVDAMEISGEKFPIHESGGLDVKAIAAQCNISVSALVSPSIKNTLDRDVERLGTEVSDAKTVEQMMDNKLSSTSSELNRYRKDLALAQDKVECLNQQILKLEKENRQLKNQSIEQDESLVYLIETGRRFSL